MGRVVGVVVVGLVTRYARGLREVVVVIHMTRRAGQRRVCAGQREAGRRVVEGGVSPVGCAVASAAIRREPKLLVVGVVGVVVVGLMTRYARGYGDVVVVIHVALRARQAGMRAGQREAGLGVVEGRIGPAGGVVATGAVGREPKLLVVRVRRVVVVVQVTRHARGLREVVIVIHVARRAR